MAGKGEPYIGVDFGTSYSTASWYDEKSGKAEAFFNSGGEIKMPSVVYYGHDEISIGQAALFSFEDDMLHGDATAPQRMVKSIKRNLLSPPAIALPGGRITRPAEVVAAIIGKLKSEIEQGRFHESVRKTVVTVPAAFAAEERAVIEAGARLAGFDEVQLLDEPVTAAMAYAAEGQKVGNNILVYDLGGGTFDLAVLTRHGKDGFEVALPPAGLPRCGGDDFDMSLYNYVAAELAKQDVILGRNGSVDLLALAECRSAKEKLSDAPRANVQLLIEGRGHVVRVTREQYESLIRERVQQTMRQTRQLLDQASAAGCKVDTVVMVGGSSRSPHVIAELGKTLRQAGLSCEPLRYDHQDIAVALGASYSRKFYLPEPMPVEIHSDLETDGKTNLEACASLCDKAAESYARNNPIESTHALLDQALSHCSERKQVLQYLLNSLADKLFDHRMRPFLYTDATVDRKCKERLLSQLRKFIGGGKVYLYCSTAIFFDGSLGFVIFDGGVCWKNANDDYQCISFDFAGFSDIKHNYSSFSTDRCRISIGSKKLIMERYYGHTIELTAGMFALISYIFCLPKLDSRQR